MLKRLAGNTIFAAGSKAISLVALLGGQSLSLRILDDNTIADLYLMQSYIIIAGAFIIFGMGRVGVRHVAMETAVISSVIKFTFTVSMVLFFIVVLVSNSYLKYIQNHNFIYEMIFYCNLWLLGFVITVLSTDLMRG